MPKYYENSLTKLAKEQRKLSHIKKGSNNYHEQLIRVKSLHEHIANQRKDFLHKVSRKLANAYDYVFVEDLDLQDMSEKKDKLRLGITIFDLGYHFSDIKCHNYLPLYFCYTKKHQGLPRCILD